MKKKGILTSKLLLLQRGKFMPLKSERDGAFTFFVDVYEKKIFRLSARTVYFERN